MDETGMTPRITVPDDFDAACVSASIMYTLTTGNLSPNDNIRLVQLAALLITDHDKDN